MSIVQVDKQTLARLRPRCECCGRLGAFASARSYAVEGDAGEVTVLTYDFRPPNADRHRKHVVLPDEVEARSLGHGRGRGGTYEFERNGKTVRTKPAMTIADVIAQHAKSPERCGKISAAMTRRWKQREYRKGMLSRMRSKEYREAQRSDTLASWRNEKVASARISGTRAATSRPEWRARAAEILRGIRSDTKLTGRRLTNLRRSLKQSDVRHRMSQSGKARKARERAEQQAMQAELARLRAAQVPRRPRGRPLMSAAPETKYRIVVAADCRLQDIGARRMAAHVFPEQQIKDNAVDATKHFLQRHAGEISTERDRPATLSGSERRAVVNAAQKDLRKLLQLG